MKTLATTFSGGGGFEAGAILAGLTPVWGVEHDPEIAGVYARNFGAHCIVSAVEDVDWSTLQRPFHHHTSPSCKKASVANKERGETAEDIAAAEGIARAIRALQSPSFSLENVWGYREFESFRTILRALEESGYAFGYWHLNAADYGVPQTRKRLILLASKTHKPRRPAPTHTQSGPSAQVDLFGGEPLQKWEGWYKTIEDLIPTLPESKFAEWQLKRLEPLFESYLISEQYADDNSNPERAPVHLKGETPAPPVLASKTSQMRAFIVEGTAAGEGNRFTLPVRASESPIFTVRGSNPLRAFLAQGTSTLDVRDESEPSACVLATVHTKAAKPRAWLSHGRVVSMTPRALARFQSIPDSYVLPEKNGLACKVIGNAVASLLARRIVESMNGAALNTEAA